VTAVDARQRAVTQLHLDLQPHGGPLLYQHGLDPSVGLSPIGRWFPEGTTAGGLRVRAVLDPISPFYDAIRSLLDDRMLGFSPGSAEHSQRINRKTGEILDWPLWEISLTPSPSNTLGTVDAPVAIRIVRPGTVQIVAGPLTSQGTLVAGDRSVRVQVVTGTLRENAD
jgi:hypothetical protein